MAIALSDFSFYLLILVAVMIPMLVIMMVLSIHKAVPWAWVMYQCFRGNLPCIMLHYAKGGVEVVKPKLEKDLREGIPHTYFYVPKWGIKIPDTAGDNTELLMGKLRVIHYFKKGTSPVNVLDAIAIDRLKDWLNRKGVNIQNREDVIMFFLNDYTKTNNILETLEASDVDDVETRNFIIHTINVIQANRKELEKLKIHDSIFTFQTAMMALDKVVAFTSAAFSDAKSAIQAQQRAKQLDDKNKDMARTVLLIAVLLVCAAVAYAIISKSGAL